MHTEDRRYTPNPPPGDYQPEVGDYFMFALRHDDRSFARSLWRCVEANGVAIVAEWEGGEEPASKRLACLVILRREARFYSVPKSMADHLIAFARASAGPSSEHPPNR